MAALVEALAARGFEALVVSLNYYEDLGARFGLEDAFLARLHDARILYDEDTNGRYFQLYSRQRSSEVFFEIVQREGGYDGYGAANAPFRVSAQKRSLCRRTQPGLDQPYRLLHFSMFIRKPASKSPLPG